MNNVYLSVIIPAYNEQAAIRNTIKETIQFLNTHAFNYEIIIVDDGSKDDTVGEAKKAAKEFNSDIIILENDINRGKGYSIKKGVMRAKGEIILFFDADLSTPLESFDKMLPFFSHGYDIVMCSRHLPDSEILVRQSRIRELAGKIFYKIVFSFFLKDITDTNCGFKAYQRAIGQELYSLLTINRWGFDAEIIYLAQKRSCKIKEIPVSWSNKANSKVNVVVAIAETIKELMQIKVNDWRGRYN